MSSITRQVQSIGFLPPPFGSPQALGMNTYTQAFGFTLPFAKTLTQFSEYCTAIAGTLASTDLVCTIRDASGTNGVPGVSLGSSSSLVSAAAASSWLRWTFGGIALSANTQYWAVITNANGTPSTNYPTLQHASNSFPIDQNAQVFGWATLYSTDGGTTWNNYEESGIRLGFSDGSYYGQPLVSVSSPNASGTTEIGLQFTTPAGASLNVSGLAVLTQKFSSGTTGNLKLKLYTGSSPVLLASATIPKNSVLTGANLIARGYFSTQTINPGTAVTITVSTDSSGDSNGYYTWQETWDADSNSLPLLPMEGTAKKAVYNGSAWSLTNNALISAALLLDPTGEFTASGGGSGGVSAARAVNGV